MPCCVISPPAKREDVILEVTWWRSHLAAPCIAGPSLLCLYSGTKHGLTGACLSISIALVTPSLLAADCIESKSPPTYLDNQSHLCCKLLHSLLSLRSSLGFLSPVRNDLACFIFVKILRTLFS